MASEYKALSTANLPDPVIDPNQDNYPAKYFDTYLYTGNGAGLQVGDVVKKPADTITISSSLLIDHNDDAYLSRSITTSSAAPEKTLTISAWVKLATIGETFGIAGNYTSLTNNDNLYITADGELRYRYESSGTLRSGVETDQTFTDTSVWNHFVFQVDTNGKSGTDAIKIWVNGVLAPYNITTAFSADENIAHLDDAAEQRVGFYHNLSSQEGDGYIAELHYIDGSTYDADTFGEFDANGIWIPKTVTGVTYGTNGFYLDFADNSTADALGTDQSGNGNDFTASVGLDTTDQVTDSPTNNCPIVWAQKSSGVTFSEGNLKANMGSFDRAARTHGLPIKGKYYWEVEADLINTGGNIGIHDITLPFGNPALASPNHTNHIRVNANGNVAKDTTTVDTSNTAISNGDIVMFAVDFDEELLWIGVNGTWYNSGDPAAGTGYVATLHSNVRYGINTYSSSGDLTSILNTGQRAFTHTAPTGFNALTEDNIEVDETNIESPDWVWIKSRTEARSHYTFDTVRGPFQALLPDDTDAETEYVDQLQEFNTNGFTIGSLSGVNDINDDYVAWNWKLGGAPTATNTGDIGGVPTSGSIMIDGVASTTALSGSLLVEKLSASTTTGASILRYVAGAGVSSGTIDHGLSQEPEFIMCKNLEVGTAQWAIGSSYFTSWSYSLELDNNGSQTSVPSRFGAAPTSSVFTVGTSGYTNSGNDKYIAYCLHSVEGFSKINTYVGNNNADGPFVYCGFRPALVMTKSLSAGSWSIYDSKRDKFNSGDTSTLSPDLTTAESGFAANAVDFLSNGFKIRHSTADGYSNAAQTYLFLAFAEQPFKYSNAR
jgi:hypothetical protein